MARAEQELPISTPEPAWVGQDPEDWWRATEAVLGSFATTPATPPASALSGQMHGLVARGSGDQVLRPATPLERPASRQAG